VAGIVPHPQDQPILLQLLVAASLLFVIATIPLMLVVIDRERVLWRWGIVGAGYIGLLLFMRFVSRRLEERQLEQNIENYRGVSRSIGTLT